MALAVHCDREDCNTWSYSSNDFLTVSYGLGHIKHYCCKWCLVVEESKNAEPTEVVE